MQNWKKQENMYTNICEIAKGNLLYRTENSNQALLQPRGVEWAKRWEGRLARAGTYVYLWLIRVHVWNVPLVSLIFLKRSPVFPILLISSISLRWSLREAFLSLLAILWSSAFKWEYLSFSPLLLASCRFTAICKASSDSHFAFLHFFSMGMVLISVSCTMSRTSIHSSSSSLSIRSSPFNLFLTSTVYS